MKPTKINISPEVREFNEQVEHADFLLDYQFDQEPAAVLLDRLQQTMAYPVSCSLLKYAISRLAIKR